MPKAEEPIAVRPSNHLLSPIRWYTISMEPLEFVYEPLFDRSANDVLTDDDLVALEYALCLDQRAGDVIPDAGGARQTRRRTGNLRLHRGSRAHLSLAVLPKERAGKPHERAESGTASDHYRDQEGVGVMSDEPIVV